MEKVGIGSRTPSSVPGVLEVYPARKWYDACSGVSFDTGGKTPYASQVSMMMFFGWVLTTQGIRALAINSMGYAQRVFSVMEMSS